MRPRLILLSIFLTAVFQIAPHEVEASPSPKIACETLFLGEKPNSNYGSTFRTSNEPHSLKAAHVIKDLARQTYHEILDEKEQSELPPNEDDFVELSVGNILADLKVRDKPAVIAPQYQNENIHYARSVEERRGFATSFENGRSNGPAMANGFVLGTDGVLYTFAASIGRIHHSTPVAGEPIETGGMMSFDSDWKLSSLSTKSGHYRPTAGSILKALRALKLKNSLPSHFIEVFLPQANNIEMIFNVKSFEIQYIYFRKPSLVGWILDRGWVKQSTPDFNKAMRLSYANAYQDQANHSLSRSLERKILRLQIKALEIWQDEFTNEIKSVYQVKN